MREIERANVPCNGCTACCHHDVIPLMPEHGDNLFGYETRVIDVPGGKPVVALKKGADGFCIYLKDGGCSIWQRAPFICRIFDCRLWYLSKTRPERRRLVKSGKIDQAVFDAGRTRLDSLPEERRGPAG